MHAMVLVVLVVAIFVIATASIAFILKAAAITATKAAAMTATKAAVAATVTATVTAVMTPADSRRQRHGPGSSLSERFVTPARHELADLEEKKHATKRDAGAGRAVLERVTHLPLIRFLACSKRDDGASDSAHHPELRVVGAVREHPVEVEQMPEHAFVGGDVSHDFLSPLKITRFTRV
jgi:hypothetical protein